MKKIIALTLTMLLLAGMLVGCGSTPAETAPKADTAAPAEAADTAEE